MQGGPDASPIESIIALADEIIDECPSCTSRVSEITVWPSGDEPAALVDATCQGLLPDDQRMFLINGLQALVRFADQANSSYPYVQVYQSAPMTGT
jgi:hypothetical protein